MAEHFEFTDLSDAVFWGVDLQRATFRDVDLMGARISHARLADVVIDAEVDGLVINGVDVTAYATSTTSGSPSVRSFTRPSPMPWARVGSPSSRRGAA